METKNKNTNEKELVVDRIGQLTLKVDRRIYKIVKYIRKKTNYPLGRMGDLAFMFLFTEHLDVITNGIAVLDVYLENHPENKQKFLEVLEKVERDELFKR